ncbi:heterokaryon incompatibility protein-domain-containing protein [Stachybotrys elegans]|uniref:Heterokaryon incompatibility protein-domain-containing protein n=1 Tax=Stachybotrys elegans TaxID=80388 RepID=A0A8K0S9Z2_9HYPO|nr:heterokaryon incompatibility protein-domain-containing protein [Stachybotrys elegans]
MRLLDATTLKLENFEHGSVPKYAVLSHRWTAQEVSMQELTTESGKQKQRFAKIRKCCEVARGDGLTHVWIDTCCIDKISSVELSEAINSMFRWYANAEVCYAYEGDSCWFD